MKFLDYIYLTETDISKSALDVQNELVNLGYNIRPRKESQPSDVIVVEIDNSHRVETLVEIEKQLKPIFGDENVIYDNYPVGSLSTIGAVKVANKARILMKTKGNTGSATKGIQNEIILIESIKHFCNKTNKINIIFDDGHKTFNCINVYDAISVGKDVQGNKKADIKILGDKEYRISLKGDSAEFWGSCTGNLDYSKEAYERLEALVAQGRVKYIPQDNGKTFISPTIAYKTKPEEAVNIIFGSDIQPDGCVIQKTFTIDIIQQINFNTYKIEVSKIITSIDDLDDDDYPWFFIQNSIQHQLYGKIKGTRLLAARKTRISGKNKNIIILT